MLRLLVHLYYHIYNICHNVIAFLLHYDLLHHFRLLIYIIFNDNCVGIGEAYFKLAKVVHMF